MTGAVPNEVGNPVSIWSDYWQGGTVFNMVVFWLTVASLCVSLVGLGFVGWQVWKTRKSADLARHAAEGVYDKLRASSGSFDAAAAHQRARQLFSEWTRGGSADLIASLIDDVKGHITSLRSSPATSPHLTKKRWNEMELHLRFIRLDVAGGNILDNRRNQITKHLDEIESDLEKCCVQSREVILERSANADA